MIILKYFKVEDLKQGMILAESIYNEEGTIELLSKGVPLTLRQIGLLENLGLLEIQIATTEEKQLEKTVIESVLDTDVEEVITSVVNQNMRINILTGEGNKPIDERHEAAIESTRDVFSKVINSEEIELEVIENTVKEMLPDMIRNNDVMMRLSQLQKSDDYTFEHSLRVSILAANIAKWLDYSQEMIEEVAQAGLLFDIGKMKIPENILKKEGKLTADELATYQKHTQFGYNVLLKTKGTSPAIKYSALQHHERMDGSGYPLRLRSSQIHEYAKIIMVCDVFDQMISEKPYGQGVSKLEAVQFLNWNSGNQFDKKIVYVFLQKISEYFMAKQVILNTGETGKVVFIDHNYPLRPLVMVGDKAIDLARNKKIKIIKIIES